MALLLMSSPMHDPDRPDAELRDLLAVIASSVYILRRHLSADDDMVRHLDRIAAHVRHGNRIARGMQSRE